MPSSLFDFDMPQHRFAVMGNPVGHSKSPYIHRLFSKQTNKNIVYDAIHVDHGGFQQAVGNFQANGGKGLNITVPFKHEAWQLANQLSPRATLAKAVNTLHFQKDGTLFGDNTDGIGLVTDIKYNQNYAIAHKKILILGAGGAVFGILGPLLEENPKTIHIANRTVSKAEELMQHFTSFGSVTASGYDALMKSDAYDLIINGTSASLQGSLPPIGTHLINQGSTLCYDLMYANEPTPFMRWGKTHGAAKDMDGLGMLVEQAAESFQLWMGVKPDTAPVLSALNRMRHSDTQN